MQAIGIILMSVGAAISYGIIHDQITARVCVEYFTLGHPPMFDTDDPTLLGLGWGIIATWWVGLLLGVPLAVSARAGSRPPRSLRSLVWPVGQLLLVMALCATVVGVLGWYFGKRGDVYLVGPVAAKLPADRHAYFLADLWAHSASYGIGLLGGAVVIVRVWRSRRYLTCNVTTSNEDRP